MADNIVEILIKFGLDKSKAEEAVRSIKEVSAAQKKASDDSEAYQRKLEEMFDREHAAREQQWKDVQTSAEAKRKEAERSEHLRKKTEEAASASAELGTAMQGTDRSATDLNKSVGFLRSQLGELGNLMRFAFNLPALSIAALAIGINKALEAVQKMEIAVAAAMAAAEQPVSNLAEQFRQMESARTQANEAFAATLKQIESGADSALAKFQAVKAALDALLDAQEKFDLAREKDPEKQADIKFAYAARRAGNSDAAEAVITTTLEAKRKRLDDEAARQRDIAVGAANHRSRESIEAELRGGTAALEAAKAKASDAANAEKESVLAYPLPGSLKRAIQAGDPAEIRAAQRMVAGVVPGTDAHIDAFVSALEQVRKLDEAINDFGARKPRMEIASAAFNAMDEAINQGGAVSDQIKQRKETAASLQPIRNLTEVNAAAAEAARKGQGEQASLLLSAASGADAINGGGRATREQADAINLLAQQLGLAGQNAQTIIGIISKLNDTQAQFAAALRSLASQAKSEARTP